MRTARKLDTVSSRLLRSSAPARREQHEVIAPYPGFRDFPSLAMRRLMTQAERAARTDAPVFIVGGAGVGKRWLASVIHAMAGGNPDEQVCIDGRWLANLDEHQGERAAIDELQQSLAVGCKSLVIHRAEELTIALQQMLLAHLLRSRSAARLIFTSTVHQDELRISGRLLPALFDAYGWAFLTVPSLQERPEDLAPLARYFAGRDASRRIGPRALDSLSNRTWSGNVRELREAILNAALSVAEGEEIGSLDRSGTFAGDYVIPRPFYSVGLNAQVDGYERHLIVQALRYCGDNQSQAARLLQINRQSLIKKMKRFGLFG